MIGVIVYLALAIKAIALSQRQSNFIDSVTHELKSPLACSPAVDDGPQHGRRAAGHGEHFSASKWRRAGLPVGRS